MAQKLREDIITPSQKGTGYKMIAKALNVGNIVWKFKVKGTVVYESVLRSVLLLWSA